MHKLTHVQVLEQIEREPMLSEKQHMLVECVTNKSASRVKESSHAMRACTHIALLLLRFSRN